MNQFKFRETSQTYHIHQMRRDGNFLIEYLSGNQGWQVVAIFSNTRLEEHLRGEEVHFLGSTLNGF